MATPSEIIATFPEFDDIPQETIDLYIELATCQTSDTCFGCAYDLAVALRAAHMMVQAVIQGSEGGGSVTSKTEGELTLKYHSGVINSKGYTNLETTNYGRQLQDLINGQIIKPRVSGVYNGSC